MHIRDLKGINSANEEEEFHISRMKKIILINIKRAILITSKDAFIYVKQSHLRST